MKKLKGMIQGNKTHDVGYRVFLLNKAMELGIEKFRASNTFENNLQAVVFYVEAELYEKYEYLSREITYMKFTLSEIKAKVL